MIAKAKKDSSSAQSNTASSVRKRNAERTDGDIDGTDSRSRLLPARKRPRPPALSDSEDDDLPLVARRTADKRPASVNETVAREVVKPRAASLAVEVENVAKAKAKRGTSSKEQGPGKTSNTAPYKAVAGKATNAIPDEGGQVAEPSDEPKVESWKAGKRKDAERGAEKLPCAPKRRKGDSHESNHEETAAAVEGELPAKK